MTKLENCIFESMVVRVTCKKCGVAIIGGSDWWTGKSVQDFVNHLKESTCRGEHQ